MRPITLIAQMQAIVKRYNDLYKTYKIKERSKRNLAMTSNCIACDGPNLKIAQTRKYPNKEYTTRIAICVDCRAENIQIINTVDLKHNSKTTIANTINSSGLIDLFDNQAINIKQDKVTSVKGSSVRNGYKLSKVQKNLYESKAQKGIESFHQELYDDGFYDKVMQSFHPIHTRLIRNVHLTKDNPQTDSLIKLINGTQSKFKLKYNDKIKIIISRESYWSRNLTDNSDNIYFKCKKGVVTQYG